MKPLAVSSLKIGAFTYTVILAHDLKRGDEKMDGHLEHSKSSITLDDDMDKQATTQTLLHEVVHEIAIQSGQDLSEGQVDAIAYGWIQVMRDNPELVRMVTK